MLMCWKVNYFTLTRERYFQYSKIQIYRTLNTPYLPTKCLNLRRIKCILLQTSFPGLFPIFLGEKLKPWEQGGYLCRPNHSLLADLNKTNQQKTSIQRLGRNLNNCYHSASGPSVRRHFFYERLFKTNNKQLQQNEPNLRREGGSLLWRFAFEVRERNP